MNAALRSETKTAIARLIDQHAPHGYAGVMRAPDDGCPIYMAAVALFDALDLDCTATSVSEGSEQR